MVLWTVRIEQLEHEVKTLRAQMDKMAATSQLSAVAQKELRRTFRGKLGRLLCGDRVRQLVDEAAWRADQQKFRAFAADSPLMARRRLENELQDYAASRYGIIQAILLQVVIGLIAYIIVRLIVKNID